MTLGSYARDAFSEVTSTPRWRRTVAYQRFLNGPVANYQLSIVIGLIPPSVGRGWIMMRSGADFSDDQVLLACWIQPTLKFLASYDAHNSPRTESAWQRKSGS